MRKTACLFALIALPMASFADEPAKPLTPPPAPPSQATQPTPPAPPAPPTSETPKATPPGPTPPPAPTPPPGANAPGGPAGPGMPGMPSEPPKPPPIPVPDLPIIKKTDLADGLVVEDMKIGDGPEIALSSLMLVHYQVALKSDPSKVFESTFKDGIPAPFPLEGMIPGWKQGLPGMKVGGIRRLTVPAKLAYGDKPNGDIPANSDLLFIIQMDEALTTEDVKVGTGDAVTGPCVPVITFTVTDAAGKPVATTDAAKPYVLLPQEVTAPGYGFDSMTYALQGMKIGGKRKIHLPGQFNSSPAILATPWPSGKPLNFEIDLIAVRNLPSQGRR